MDVKEAVSKLGGDYEDLQDRLSNDEVIIKFFKKFVNEQSFITLEANLNTDNTEGAFKAAHVLTGIAQNLSFGKLAVSSANCCDVLRSGNLAEGKRLFPIVRDDYQTVLEVLEEVM